MIEVKYARGIQLPEHDLWLDPWDRQAFAFVSHAHSDHTGNHKEVITSATTSRLMAERVPGRRVEHVLPFGETATLRGMRITLLPAGHVFGSAQFFLEEDGDSLLYTGDFKLRRGLSAEAAEWRQADTLIMETTYGLPRYVFPPAEEIVARMAAFCKETIEEDAVPILFGYSLGKSQEILCALARAGLTPDAARFGAPDNGNLPQAAARLPSIPQIRRERRGREGADLPAEREPLADGTED